MTDDEQAALYAMAKAAGDVDGMIRIGSDAYDRARLEQAEARLIQTTGGNPATIYSEYSAALAAGDHQKAARIAAGHPRAIETGHQLDVEQAAEREAKALDELDKAGRLRTYRQLLRDGKPHLAAQFRAIHRTRITDAETRLARVLKGQ